jgi:hypothetical protein
MHASRLEGSRDTKFPIGTGNIELFEISVAVEKFFMIRDAIVFDPDVRTLQTFGESTNMCFPISDEEIEIVRSVYLRSC